MIKTILLNDTRPNMPVRLISFQTRAANNVWWLDVITSYPETGEEIDRKQVPFLTYTEAVNALDKGRTNLLKRIRHWNRINPDELSRQRLH